jgi:hypothetical protein
MRPRLVPTLLPLLAAAVLIAPSPVRADVVGGSRSELLVEQAHWAKLLFDRGHAALVVHRTVHNGGPRHDQAQMMIDVPEPAVAVDLRTLSVKDGRPVWYRADLMEAGAAAAKYRELTGIGGYYPKDPALLSWRHAGLLALQVFPVAPGEPKTVEYTLELPASYHDGRYHVALPRMGTERLHPRVEITPVCEGDRVFVDDKPAGASAAIVLDKDTIDVAIAPHAPPQIDGALASVPVGPGHVLSHLRIDAAPRISETPRGAYVVVIVDASRSFDDHRRRTGIAAVRAALSHFADARVEVLTFDRDVRSALGGFVPVGRAVEALGGLAVVPRNGSRVDDALARADALLSKAPAGAARRILAVTDLLTRSATGPAAVHLASGALLHVGVMDGGWGGASLGRDDDHPWAKVARATGGLVWTASGSDAPVDAAEMARVYEEWARPVRIDKLVVSARGIAEGAIDARPSLLEGEGIEDLRLGDADVTEATIRGELWATPVEKAFRPDDDEARRWSALAFGAPEIREALSEPEMMVLAMRGHAVSPVTSLLAIEPGVRPSTEGLEEIGSIGFGSGFGSAHGRLGGSHATRAARASLQDILHDALAKGLRACGGEGRAATVVLETTRDEVVDVTSATLMGPRDAAVERCLHEAAWDLDLPPVFSDPWERWTIVI